MSEVVNLEALLEDEAKLKDVGSQITKLALRAALEDKMKLEPSLAPNKRSIQIGDIVPPDLTHKIPLKDGLASKNWSDAGWTDIGVWERSTWDKEGTGKVKLEDLRSLDTLERTKLINKLNSDEVNILKKMQFID